MVVWHEQSVELGRRGIQRPLLQGHNVISAKPRSSRYFHAEMGLGRQNGEQASHSARGVTVEIQDEAPIFV
jgi:hypothetical protein